MHTYFQAQKSFLLQVLLNFCRFLGFVITTFTSLLLVDIHTQLTCGSGQFSILQVETMSGFCKFNMCKKEMQVDMSVSWIPNPLEVFSSNWLLWVSVFDVVLVTSDVMMCRVHELQFFLFRFAWFRKTQCLGFGKQIMNELYLLNLKYFRLSRFWIWVFHE